jgi:predicted Zn-dependent protease with MMP-like domain
MFELDLAEFQEVITEAIESLPDEFKSKLDNVDVVVEDHPPRAFTRKLPPGGLLLGLYQGVPQKRRTSRYSLVMPDKISIYKKNIEAISSSREDIYKRIRKTLLHEIGHHFSLTDMDLRRMGW